MKATHTTARTAQGYSIEDAADFLEFDAKSIEYWLRMGHLSGDWDTRRNCLEISPRSIVEFLKQAREPMPTGSGYRNRAAQGSTRALTAKALAD